MALQREQVVQTAEKYVSRGKIEPAIREYRKLLADNPNDINTLNRIGDLYARIQRIDEAVDFFTLIAEQYTTEGFFVKAIAIYKKIIKLDPTRLEVYEKLAELYHKQGLVNEARTQYQVLADYYQKHDNAPSAIAIYQKMADVEPNNPTYHVKLAEIYQQQQLTEKAVGEYKMIAELMLAHGRSQDAAQVYERALDVDSSNLGFINDAVLKLKESGNTAAAARFLSVAAERNPQAARIARLARVEEVEVEAEPATPVPPAAPPEPRFDAAETQFAMPVELPPAVEGPRAFAGEPAEEPGPATDLAAAMRAAEAATTAPHVAGPPSGEIELNLDEVFMLDMEDEAEPTSLVKPPPDMEAAGRLGSAWAHGQEAAEEVIAEAFGVEPAFTLEPEPRAAAEVEAEAELETELEAEPEVEAEVAEVEPAVELAPPAMDSFESIELPRDSEMLLALEPAELPNLDSASWKLEAEPRETAPRAIDADMLERTAAELHAPAERDEDLVSEAEVLAKYGLEEKALERLREALRLRPRNLEAYAVMIQIHLGRDRHDRVVQLANAMAQAAAETRDDAQIWPRTKKQLAAAGYRFDAQRLIAGPHGVVEPEPAPPVLEAPVPELPATEMLPAVELPELEPPPVAEAAEVSFPEPPAAFAPRAPAAPPTEAPARRRRSTGPDIDQMLRGLLDGEPRRPATRRAAAAAAAPVAPAEAPAPAPPPAAPPPSGPPAGPPVLFNPLEIGEMIEREELDWQPAEPSPATPPSPAFQIPPPVVPGPPASGERRAHPGLDDTGGLSWLDEADHGRTPKSAGAQRLFDEEEDFFDLAAELEHELSQEDVFQTGDGLLMQPAEQSLEEIVEGFKKGVAEHLSPTDFDTHFNLGIAYREMGLLDEAIGEFQIAAKDPRHLVLCCSMLGLCFLDKGLPELAVKWYRRGLDTPGLNEEDMLGLLYDLGCAHLAVGDKDSAYKAFVDLYGINTNYRDVVARIEELGR
jgi:tetratricopeptide (TPR) repeat protein